MKATSPSNRQSGFSLIELMIVVTVIAILGAVVIPHLKTYREKALIASAENAGHQILNALTAYAATSPGNRYPVEIQTLDDVINITRQNGARITDSQREIFDRLGGSPIQVQYRCFICDNNGNNCIEVIWRPSPPPPPVVAALGPDEISLYLPLQGIDRPAGQELYLRINSVEGVRVQTGLTPLGP